MDFKPLDNKAQEYIAQWVKKSNYQGSDFSVFAFVGWYDDAEYAFAKDAQGNDVFLLRAKKDGKQFYWRPLGEGDINLALGLVEKNCPVAFITEDAADTIDKSKYDLHTVGDDDEYVYSASEFIAMSGKKFHAKRNHVAKFESLYPSATLERYRAEDKADVENFALEWIDAHEQNEEAAGREESVEKENRIVKAMLSASLQDKTIAAVLRVENKVVGVSVAEVLPSGTAIVMYEKADVDYEGSYTYLARNFAAKYLSDCTWLNRQEDMGMEGLRKSKLSYYPDHLLKKFTAVSVDADDEIKNFFAENNEKFGIKDGYVQLKEKDYDAAMSFLVDGINSLSDKRHFLNYTDDELKSMLASGYMLAHVKDGVIAATCGVDSDKKYGDELKQICGGKEDEGQYYEFSGIMVSAAYRHTGLGSDICARVVDWAKQNVKPCTLCAVVQFDNVASLGNLKKLGFVERAEKPYGNEFVFKYLTLKI